MLPPIFRTFFARRKAAQPRCTADNLERYGISPDCIARSEPYWRNQPETIDETITRDMMPDRYRRAEGEQE